MKHLRHASLALVSLLCLGAPVHAQDHRRTDARRAEIPTTQEMSFSDELVESQLVRPDETTCRGYGHPTRISLIHMRQHFANEMFKSVENL